MKKSNATLLGAAIGAGLLWLIKKAKNQPKGVIDPDYMSYEEIKKEIDFQNSVLIYDSHTDIAVCQKNGLYYVVFTHYGFAGKDNVMVRNITSDTYMKLRTEDNIPVTTEDVDVAVSGIGATKKPKRRIWAEVEAAQRAGVDLADKEGYTKSWDALRKLAKGKIPEDGIKPMEVRYFNQLRRAYKSVAGTTIRPDTSIVRNEYGDVVLVYNDYHLDQLPKRAVSWIVGEAETDTDIERGAYWSTIAYIADGGKFVWNSTKNGVHRGVCELIFGKSAPEERKRRISYLASPEKGGLYPEQLAHKVWEADVTGRSDDMQILNGILEAISACTSVGQAQQMCIDEYLKAHQAEEPLLYEDVPF